jgi:hypothetical protein
MQKLSEFPYLKQGLAAQGLAARLVARPDSEANRPARPVVPHQASRRGERGSRKGKTAC